MASSGTNPELERALETNAQGRGTSETIMYRQGARSSEEVSEEEEVIRRVGSSNLSQEGQEEKGAGGSPEVREIQDDMEFEEESGIQANPEDRFFKKIQSRSNTISEEDGAPEDTTQDLEELQSIQDGSIIHLAKKNLCFELEYIQTVCQSLDIRMSIHFGKFSKQLMKQTEEDPLAAHGGKSDNNVRFKEHIEIEEEFSQSIKIVDNQNAAQKKMRTYLEQVYRRLNTMKKESLSSDSRLPREALRKQLITMACCLERTRLYLDSYIYPRDLSLNLIDVDIEEKQSSSGGGSLANPESRKKAMHLTERLYNIVYKDFFTAYEKATLFTRKINKLTGQDLAQQEAEQERLQGGANKISVQLNNELLEDDRESIMLKNEDLDGSSKMGKEAEDARRHISRKQGGVNQDMKGMVRILQGFHPELPPFTNVEEIMELELAFVLKLKSVIPGNHELQMSLFSENGHPYSVPAYCDQAQQQAHHYAEQTFVFVKVSLRALMLNNLALVIKINEKRRGKGQAPTFNILGSGGQYEQPYNNKAYKGFTILPLSKLFWVQQLKVKQLYEIREAQFYKPMPGILIEDKYATLIEKRCFKKFKDPQTTQFFNMSYTYKFEPHFREDQLSKQGLCRVVPRINFDSHVLARDPDHHRKQFGDGKTRLDKYRYNELKIDLCTLNVSEATQKKSPVIRVEVALRDNYGVVYDTVYRTVVNDPSDQAARATFMQTFETCIYPSEAEGKEVRFGGEGFFVRIPTKSLDTLKKIYLLFMVQTLTTPKDSKGNKIKASNFHQDIEQLQFRTEMVAVLPLYDFQDNSIIKNRLYHLDLLQIEDPKKPIPTKFEYFRGTPSSVSNLKPAVNDRLNVSLRLVSNEFTHNTYINNLLLLKEHNVIEAEVETILRSLKNLKETNEQILFHDKILDKLFQLAATNFKQCVEFGQLSDDVGDLIFETIILMIDLFENRYQDYREILEGYISKHFAHAKVYKPLLQQIDQMSLKIKAGLTESSQNEEKNGYVLMTMKYLGIILKLVRNSYLEAQTCMDEQSEEQMVKYAKGHTTSESTQVNQGDYYQKQKMEIMYKKSMIAEVDEESDDEDGMVNKSSKRMTNRKGAIRRNTNTVGESQSLLLVDPESPDREMTRREFGIMIQSSLRNIFEGCHKDDMKTTLSLRAILYENITQIFENITDFMDDQFLHQVLRHIYDESSSRIVRGTASAQPQKPETASKKAAAAKGEKQLQGIMKKSQKDDATSSMAGGNSRLGKERRSEVHGILGGQEIFIDLDYITNERNVRALQDWNWINEEAITKLKIVAMGKMLAHGIFDKVQGDTNKLVLSFCENIERYHLKRPELNLHCFYFLHQLFQYLKSPDEFAEYDEWRIEQERDQRARGQDPSFLSSGGKKLHIFSKTSLDLRDFYCKVIPEVSSFLRTLFKDSNIDDKVKASKLPQEIMKPFKEKASLVFLSLANALTRDKIAQWIFAEPKKLNSFVKTLKKLSNKISFGEPYQIYFEKKKVQVLRKLVENIISLFMEQQLEAAAISAEYKETIYSCRLMMIYLWNKLARIKQDQKATVRSKTLVKDQLKVHKGKMLDTFRGFWRRFKSVGQPWKSIKGSFLRQFIIFIKLSHQKAIHLFMEVASDIMIQEYLETKSVFDTSSSIFKVFYDLKSSAQPETAASQSAKTPRASEDLADLFYKAFEKAMHAKAEEYLESDPVFVDLLRQRVVQMRGLSESIQSVTFSRVNMKDNHFYRAYCMAQLIEVLWELKLFGLFQENREQFETLNSKLSNNLEVGYTSLRFVETMEHQGEDERMLIGQKEIVAQIQLQQLKVVQKFFEKAEFYEKAIEILNKQKHIAENMLFDFELVSQIVKSQYKIYKTLAQDQNRYFAVYFKLGFFGQSFPIMFRNKEFIYRGSRLIRRGDVKDKIQKYFPDAFMLDYTAFPEVAVLESQKKSLQIQKVDPLTYLELKDFDLLATCNDPEEIEMGKKATELPSKLRTYYLENFKNQFYKQTMIKSQGSGNEELQQDRLIEIFSVKSKFPTIFNMQEIVRTVKFTRHAIDEAIRNIQMIIDQIEQFKKQATQSHDQSDFESLTSTIRAALESPIQGGVVKYVNTFINEQNLRGPQREKTLVLFGKIQECEQAIMYGIQAIQSFSYEETILTKIAGDEKQFKDTIHKVASYIFNK